MQYRKDNRSKNTLSVLGMGCMRLPRNSKGQDDLGKAEKLICDAIEQGINYFDTAYLYGKSEEILGAALYKSKQRERVYIATKLPHQKCKTSEDFDRYFNEQLERLQTTYIDYYLIHNITSSESFERLLALDLASWVASKKASGALKQMGFSFHGSQGTFMQLIDAFDWDFCQIQYNYMDENYQAGRKGLQRAHEKGLPVIVMEPLLGGKLATGLPKRAAEFFKGANSERTPAAWALQWLWDQPEVTVVLSGMNSFEQLEENVRTAEDARVGMLTAEDKEVIEAVVEDFRSAYKVDCTGCNYCMPCPKGINIPGCFAAYNARYVTGYVSAIALYVTSAAGQPDKVRGPSSCIACGACEKLCPQHLPIIDSLRSAKKVLEPFWLRAGLKLYSKTIGAPSPAKETP